MKTKEEHRKECLKILNPVILTGAVFLFLTLLSPILFIWIDSEIVIKIFITLLILKFISFFVYTFLEKIVIISADKLFEEELLNNPEGKSKFQQKMDKMMEEAKSK